MLSLPLDRRTESASFRLRVVEMALVCFVSQKGSPGTTLTALAVAAGWPGDGERKRLFVEADPFGGVLALRYQLGHEPGLMTLAAALRGGIGVDDVWAHAQELPGGLAAIIGPDRPDQANAVLAATGDRLGAWLADLDGVDVIADVGRVATNSHASDLLEHADLVLMVARPNVEQLQPAAQRMQTLGIAAEKLRWILIGERPHNRDEVEATFGIAVAGVVADDPRGARALEQGSTPTRLRRTAIVRTATALADDLAQSLYPKKGTNDPGEPPAAVEAADLVPLGGLTHDR